MLSRCNQKLRRINLGSIGITVAFALGYACGGATEPAKASSPTYTISGTYALRVVSDSLAPDCFGGGDACKGGNHPDSTGVLSGHLVIDTMPLVQRFTVHNGTTVTGTDSSLTFSNVHATLDARACAAFNGDACVMAAPAPTRPYNGTLKTDVGFPAHADVTGQLVSPTTDDLQSATISLTGRFVGDSLVGRMVWYTNTGRRNPPTYSGPFVARRLP